MPRGVSVHSTSPLNTSSRRNLAQAAAAVVGGCHRSDPPAAGIRSSRGRSALNAQKGNLRGWGAAEVYDDDIERCFHEWTAEYERLIAEADAGRLEKTRAEVWEIIMQHPSGSEQSRLDALQAPHCQVWDKLIKEIWPIPATTTNYRRAKVEVLLVCILATSGASMTMKPITTSTWPEDC
jgi:hypothetical protein